MPSSVVLSTAGLARARTGVLARRARPRRGARALARRVFNAEQKCVRETGTAEPTDDANVVRRTIAVDLGGATPASVGLPFASTGEAVCVELERPLGIVFEQRLKGVTTEIFVDEVVEGGNAARAGVRPGDVLRLTTAVFLVSAAIDVTTWLNPPSKRNVKAFLECDGKSFDKVMDAIASHSVQIDTPNGKEDVKTVGMVLERAGDV